jgi:raffinose/stachyose/melibiose transport system permease protein
MPGMILIETTFGQSFSILMFRAFFVTVPREVYEAAVLDGAGRVRMFFQVILPLLRPVIVTVIVVQSVFVFNDFQNPLYFLPGADNATVQTTLYSFAGQNLSFYNLLFMDFLLITIPPLVAYIFFNRQIIAGMTSGAVKG